MRKSPLYVALCCALFTSGMAQAAGLTIEQRLALLEQRLEKTEAEASGVRTADRVSHLPVRSAAMRTLAVLVMKKITMLS